MRRLLARRDPGADAVRAEQPVDGAAQTDSGRGMSAPEMSRRGGFAGPLACNRAAE